MTRFVEEDFVEQNSVEQDFVGEDFVEQEQKGYKLQKESSVYYTK